MKTRSQTLKRKAEEECVYDLVDKNPVRKTPSKKETKRKEKKEKKNTQPKITDFYKREEKKEETLKKKTGYDEETGCWHCLECGENMGTTNSRQLCGKYYCFYSY